MIRYIFTRIHILYGIYLPRNIRNKRFDEKYSTSIWSRITTEGDPYALGSTYASMLLAVYKIKFHLYFPYSYYIPVTHAACIYASLIW